jgi:hypothetical protein
MPITIENDQYEFELVVHTLAPGKLEPEFNLFLEVRNVLVIYPVKFEIEVQEADKGAENPTESADSKPDE